MNVDSCKFNSTNKNVELFDKAGTVLLVFELRRLKSATGTEMLRVTVTDGTQTLGEDCIKPVAIQEGLLNFKQFGIVLSRKVYADISKQIEEHYFEISSKPYSIPTELTKERINAIFLMFCDYIEDFKVPKKVDSKNQESYNIPVATFLEYLKDSDYEDFDSTKIRKGLRDSGYTICNPGRTDRAVIDEESKKPIKAISFKAKRVKDRM